MGEENEISHMLTQCALRDESLAEAILQSALHINKDRTVAANAQNLSLQHESSNQ